MSSTAPLTDAQQAWLRTHRWCLVGTTRRSGAPQASMVAYHFDGTDIVVSCRRTNAKVANIERQPQVVVVVADDDRYLSVAGTAEVVRTGERLVAITERLRDALPPPHAERLQGELDQGLEAVGRVALVVTPSGALGRID